jgi:hypothetical protein
VNSHPVSTRFLTAMHNFEAKKKKKETPLIKGFFPDPVNFIAKSCL